MNKTWVVTGASKGIGLVLVKALLRNNQKVVATSRDKQQLIDRVGEENALFLPVTLDLTDERAIKNVVNKGVEKFGTLDILVNNAGFLMAGTVEDITDEEARSCFDINLFGSLNMIRAVLPIMRQQQSGHIINTSSIAGLRSGPLEGIYSATKFAINGISYALAEEVKPFNIHVTNIAPGFIRTEFLEKTSYRLTHSSDAYQETVAERVGFANLINGNQPGSPEKLARLYMQVVQMEQPPLDLLVGSDAVEIATAVLHDKMSNINEYQWLSSSIDYEEKTLSR